MFYSSTEGKEYGKKAKKTSQSIKENVGFYLWGRYTHNGFWNNIYLGKSGYGKTTSLQERICKELKADRLFLWRTVLTQERILELMKKYNPNQWENSERSFRNILEKKIETTHIVWVAVPGLENNQNVNNVEKDLIETLNPTANMLRPVPPAELQEWTHKIIAEFRRQIHNSRNTRFDININN